MAGVTFPTGSEAFGYVPQLPVINGSAKYCPTNACGTQLTPEWFNSVASEIIALSDKLGKSYDTQSKTNAADAVITYVDGIRQLAIDTILQESEIRSLETANLEANKADKVVTITGGGLATGGGSLANNRVITVPIATAFETLDMIRNDVAVTPSSLATLYADIQADIAAAVGGGPSLGNTTVNPDGSFEIGRNGTGNRAAYIDFHASGLPGAIDYSARIFRGAGTGGWLELYNNGAGSTGAIRIQPADGQNVFIGTDGLAGGLFVCRQNNADEGGQITLQRCVTNTTLSADVVIDQFQTQIRMFENGGSTRGASLDLTGCAGGIGSPITHYHNIGAHIAAAVPAGALGSYGLLRGSVGAVVEGNNYAGSSLFWTNVLNSSTGGTVSGTWRCHGRTNASNEATLFQRVA